MIHHGDCACSTSSVAATILSVLMVLMVVVSPATAANAVYTLPNTNNATNGTTMPLTAADLILNLSHTPITGDVTIAVCSSSGGGGTTGSSLCSNATQPLTLMILLDEIVFDVDNATVTIQGPPSCSAFGPPQRSSLIVVMRDPLMAPHRRGCMVLLSGCFRNASIDIISNGAATTTANTTMILMDLLLVNVTLTDGTLLTVSNLRIGTFMIGGQFFTMSNSSMMAFSSCSLSLALRDRYPEVLPSPPNDFLPSSASRSVYILANHILIDEDSVLSLRHCNMTAGFYFEPRTKDFASFHIARRSSIILDSVVLVSVSVDAGAFGFYFPADTVGGSLLVEDDSFIRFESSYISSDATIMYLIAGYSTNTSFCFRNRSRLEIVGSLLLGFNTSSDQSAALAFSMSNSVNASIMFDVSSGVVIRESQVTPGPQQRGVQFGMVSNVDRCRLHFTRGSFFILENSTITASKDAAVVSVLMRSSMHPELLVSDYSSFTLRGASTMLIGQIGLNIDMSYATLATLMVINHSSISITDAAVIADSVTYPIFIGFMKTSGNEVIVKEYSNISISNGAILGGSFGLFLYHDSCNQTRVDISDVSFVGFLGTGGSQVRSTYCVVMHFSINLIDFDVTVANHSAFGIAGVIGASSSSSSSSTPTPNFGFNMYYSSPTRVSLSVSNDSWVGIYNSVLVAQWQVLNLVISSANTLLIIMDHNATVGVMGDSLLTSLDAANQHTPFSIQIGSSNNTFVGVTDQSRWGAFGNSRLYSPQYASGSATVASFGIEFNRMVNMTIVVDGASIVGFGDNATVDSGFVVLLQNSYGENLTISVTNGSVVGMSILSGDELLVGGGGVRAIGFLPPMFFYMGYACTNVALRVAGKSCIGITSSSAPSSSSSSSSSILPEMVNVTFSSQFSTTPRDLIVLNFQSCSLCNVTITDESIIGMQNLRGVAGGGGGGGSGDAPLLAVNGAVVRLTALFSFKMKWSVSETSFIGVRHVHHVLGVVLGECMFVDFSSGTAIGVEIEKQSGIGLQNVVMTTTTASSSAPLAELLSGLSFGCDRCQSLRVTVDGPGSFLGVAGRSVLPVVQQVVVGLVSHHSQDVTLVIVRGGTFGIHGSSICGSSSSKTASSSYLMFFAAFHVDVTLSDMVQVSVTEGGRFGIFDSGTAVDAFLGMFVSFNGSFVSVTVADSGSVFGMGNGSVSVVARNMSIMDVSFNGVISGTVSVLRGGLLGVDAAVEGEDSMMSLTGAPMFDLFILSASQTVYFAALVDGPQSTLGIRGGGGSGERSGGAGRLSPLHLHPASAACLFEVGIEGLSASVFSSNGGMIGIADVALTTTSTVTSSLPLLPTVTWFRFSLGGEGGGGLVTVTNGSMIGISSVLGDDAAVATVSSMMSWNQVNCASVNVKIKGGSGIGVRNTVTSFKWVTAPFALQVGLVLVRDATFALTDSSWMGVAFFDASLDVVVSSSIIASYGCLAFGWLSYASLNLRVTVESGSTLGALVVLDGKKQQNEVLSATLFLSAVSVFVLLLNDTSNFTVTVSSQSTLGFRWEDTSSGSSPLSSALARTSSVFFRRVLSVVSNVEKGGSMTTASHFSLLVNGNSTAGAHITDSSPFGLFINSSVCNSSSTSPSWSPSLFLFDGCESGVDGVTTTTDKTASIAWILLNLSSSHGTVLMVGNASVFGIRGNMFNDDTVNNSGSVCGSDEPSKSSSSSSSSLLPSNLVSISLDMSVDAVVVVSNTSVIGWAVVSSTSARVATGNTIKFSGDSTFGFSGVHSTGMNVSMSFSGTFGVVVVATTDLPSKSKPRLIRCPSSSSSSSPAAAAGASVAVGVRFTNSSQLCITIMEANSALLTIGLVEVHQVSTAALVDWEGSEQLQLTMTNLTSVFDIRGMWFNASTTATESLTSGGGGQQAPVVAMRLAALSQTLRTVAAAPVGESLASPANREAILVHISQSTLMGGPFLVQLTGVVSSLDNPPLRTILTMTQCVYILRVFPSASSGGGGVGEATFLDVTLGGATTATTLVVITQTSFLYRMEPPSNSNNSPPPPPPRMLVLGGSSSSSSPLSHVVYVHVACNSWLGGVPMDRRWYTSWLVAASEKSSTVIVLPIAFGGCTSSSSLSLPTHTLDQTATATATPAIHTVLELSTAYQAMSGMSGVTAVVSSMVMPVGALAAHRFTLLASIGACSGGDLPSVSDVLSTPVDTMNAPLRMNIGPSIGAPQRGAVVGNVILWVGVAVACGLAVVCRRLFFEGVTDIRDAMSTLRMPGLYVMLAQTLLQQVVISSCLLLFQPVSPQQYDVDDPPWTPAYDTVIAVCGLILAAAMFAVVIRVLGASSRTFRAVADPVDDEEQDQLSKDARSMVFKAALWLKRETCEWLPRDEEADGNFVPRYGFMFEGCRGGFHWWMLLDMTMTWCMSIIAGYVPMTTRSCMAEVWTTVVLCGMLLIAALYFRPTNNRLDMGILFVIYTSQFALALCAALDVPAQATSDIGIATSALSLILLALNVLCVLWLETKRYVGLLLSAAARRRQRHRNKGKRAPPPLLEYPSHDAAATADDADDVKVYLPCPPSLRDLIERICRQQVANARGVRGGSSEGQWNGINDDENERRKIVSLSPQHASKQQTPKLPSIRVMFPS